MDLARPYAAIVLAGGRGARLGGADKATVELGGRRLLDRVLDAAADAREVVVVGDPVELPASSGRPPVRFVREEPPHAGPAAALLCALDALGAASRRVAVLAVDMPLLDADTIQRLHDAADGADRADGAVLVDADGRRQLAVVLDVAPLAAVRAEHHDATGLPLWRLLGPLDLVEVTPLADEHRDVDTWDDLAELDGLDADE